jgi:hypothetical protein
MVHSLKTIASVQDRDHQSIAYGSLLEPNNSVPDVLDVVAGKANQISSKPKGAISQRLTQTL